MEKRSPFCSVCLSVTVVVVVFAAEYLARHFVAPLLPVLVTRGLNDILVSATTYVAVSLLVVRVLGRPTPNGALLGVVGACRKWQGWVGGPLALLVAILLSFADRHLWPGVSLPSIGIAWTGTGLGVAPLWVASVALLIANGVVIPIAEEWLWRGVVQPGLVLGLGVPGGIVATAALFSVKHAFVDASLDRLLTITGVGLILGLVAHGARSWKVSAISHVIMNCTATLLVLFGTNVLPTCLADQPAISTPLQSATSRVLALVDAPEPEEIEALFAPSFLRVIDTEKTVAFFERVHRNSGHCSWRCATGLVGENRVTGFLACDGLPALMTLEVDSEAPHKITYLVIISNPAFYWSQ
jgi:membrane protease YdiL (CAAX protease family)